MYSIGIQKKDTVFYCDLCSLDVIKQLKNLPHPDIIVASPMCESWSMGSNMENGNACWIDDTNTNLFNSDDCLRIRNRDSYQGSRFNYLRSLHKRTLGELCVAHLVEILEHFKPTFWYIENPQYSRMWLYLKKYVNFYEGFRNIAHYHCYDDETKNEIYSRKPTCFLSNILIPLKANYQIKAKKQINVEPNYDIRSKIPTKLIQDIFDYFVALWCETHNQKGQPIL